MPGNSTPTFFPNLADFGLEVVGAALSPAIYVAIPADDTVALGPTQNYVIDTETDVASPHVDYVVDYLDIFVYSAAPVAATGLNIIQHAQHSQIYSDELILDVDTVAPLGSGSVGLGSHRHEIIYVTPASYELTENKSQATVVNPHSTLVSVSIPSSAPAGTTYNFVALSGQIKVYSPGTHMWVGASGWVSPANQNYTLPRGTNAKFVCDGQNNWFNARPADLHYFSQVSFNPLDLPGLASWLDASDSITITKDGSDRVSLWEDKGPNGADVAQATDAKKPTWLAANINGLDVVDFDGAADILVNSTAGGTFNGSSGEIWMVFKPDIDNANYMPFGSADEATGVRYFGAIFLSANKSISALQKENDTETIVGGGTLNANSTYIVRITSNGTAYGLSINGVDISPSVFGGTNNGDWFADTTARDNFSVGGIKFNGTEANFFNGKMCELMVIEGMNLSESNKTLHYSYLSNKWGV